MDQRGRKSLENLSVVTSIPGQRPVPPESLGAEERQIWQRVVATHPWDWFPPSTACLLSEYCRAWVKSNEIAAALAVYEGVPEGDDLTRWLKLRKAQDETARLLTALGTKMRITNQSMRTERAAATGLKNTAGEYRKPWEYGNAG